MQSCTIYFFFLFRIFLHDLVWYRSLGILYTPWEVSYPFCPIRPVLVVLSVCPVPLRVLYCCFSCMVFSCLVLHFHWSPISCIDTAYRVFVLSLYRITYFVCTVFVLYHYCITYFIVLDLYCTLLYLYFIATVFVPYHYFIDPLIVRFGLYLYCTTMESMLSLITYGSGAYSALHL